MSEKEVYITVLLILAVTVLPRFLPFIVFPEGKKPPKFLSTLGTTLPYAVIGALVVYCFKGVSVTAYPHGIPELIALAVIVVLHMWRHNTLLSMAAGTVAYMLLVQFVFI